MSRSLDVLLSWYPGVPVLISFPGVLVCLFPGFLLSWCSAVLVFLVSGVPESWCFVVLVSWFPGGLLMVRVVSAY